MKEFQKKVEACRKELIGIANFISEKGLKFKQASTHEAVLDYFRGKIHLKNLKMESLTMV
jgi:hypothetical protein